MNWCSTSLEGRIGTSCTQGAHAEQTCTHESCVPYLQTAMLSTCKAFTQQAARSGNVEVRKVVNTTATIRHVTLQDIHAVAKSHQQGHDWVAHAQPRNGIPAYDSPASFAGIIEDFLARKLAPLH